jgi:2'-5' RNA ligase
MRCFIAIDINEKIREGLTILQNKLQAEADVEKGDVKWVDPHTIHLTLKFLGEIKDQQLADVCSITKDVVGRHEGFELDVESVGCFGGRSARVLWVGAGQGCDNLLKLQKDLEQQLASAGWPEEHREFTGHLTLCRIKDSKAGLKLAQLVDKYKDFKLGTISVDSLSVYQSDLTPKGPIYTLLCNYKLQ